MIRWIIVLRGGFCLTFHRISNKRSLSPANTWQFQVLWQRYQKKEKNRILMVLFFLIDIYSTMRALWYEKNKRWYKSILKAGQSLFYWTARKYPVSYSKWKVFSSFFSFSYFLFLFRDILFYFLWMDIVKIRKYPQNNKWLTAV